MKNNHNIHSTAVIGIDPITDLAVLKINKKTRPITFWKIDLFRSWLGSLAYLIVLVLSFLLINQKQKEIVEAGGTTLTPIAPKEYKSSDFQNESKGRESIRKYHLFFIIKLGHKLF